MIFVLLLLVHSGWAQIATINDVYGDANGNFNISGSTNIQTFTSGLNVTIDTTSNVTFTTLDVANTILPSGTTTCPNGPLSASCVDGGLAPACTTPVGSACLPVNATITNVNVTGTVNVTNAYITLMQNQTAISAAELTSLQSTILEGATAVCSSKLPTSCFDPSGYMCAINQTLPSNCFPTTQTFTNVTVTNTLRIGTSFVCPNGPALTNTSCMPLRVFSINGINATNFTILGTNGITAAGATLSVSGPNGFLVTGRSELVTKINFLGTVAVTASGATTNININSPLTVQKNSVSVGTPTSINFVGANIVASGSNPTNIYVQDTFRPLYRNTFGPGPGANISSGGYIDMSTLISNDGSTSTIGWSVNQLYPTAPGPNNAGTTLLTIDYTTTIGSVTLCANFQTFTSEYYIGPTGPTYCGTAATPGVPGLFSMHYRQKYISGGGVTRVYVYNNGPTYWVPGANDRVVAMRFA